MILERVGGPHSGSACPLVPETSPPETGDDRLVEGVLLTGKGQQRPASRGELIASIERAV